ncbi:MAG: 1-acyl-sn-glycerol-3-phosphate acyltransferase [Paramuribaculum sp.]|nr:1-acyl-sn-glycerol-3-phosphate acyltransferase [Paramuribaculum sp.]
MAESDKPLQIDVDSVLRSRTPGLRRFLPRFAVRWLERLICQPQMNEFLARYGHLRDAEFCRALVDYLDITYTVDGDVDSLDDKRVIVACNHPLGGLDGMILIELFTRLFGTDVKFLVNNLLMAVEPLRGVFLPVNKYGHQSRDAARQVDEAFSGDAPVLIFPAGLCSRKSAGGVIADLEWQKTFINKAVKYHRDIIPVHFSGQNSRFFYNFAKFRKRVGIKFNIEMVRLPREVFLSRGKSFVVTIGAPVSWQSLKGGADAAQEALDIRRRVYSLAPEVKVADN